MRNQSHGQRKFLTVQIQFEPDQQNCRSDTVNTKTVYPITRIIQSFDFGMKFSPLTMSKISD